MDLISSNSISGSEFGDSVNDACNMMTNTDAPTKNGKM